MSALVTLARIYTRQSLAQAITDAANTLPLIIPDTNTIRALADHVYEHAGIPTDISPLLETADE
ncbi:hypothetical protein [Bifidobacterium callimiconis]|uniref:Uncharacterized protein n=1 Tax=Bifidobacterium callimiconis TaxID=2306973 RepID=A0A430FIP4_9BIFI|nr:hypothetical protein [Bifidobacterium callimiconis]RSX52670.1 hypothetical protein D2E23_0398 [Bifidobacterium callimiconis]